jgi:hypothetical protein
MMWLTLFCKVPFGLCGAKTPWQLERDKSRMEAARPATSGRFLFMTRLG